MTKEQRREEEIVKLLNDLYTKGMSEGVARAYSEKAIADHHYGGGQAIMTRLVSLIREKEWYDNITEGQ